VYEYNKIFNHLSQYGSYHADTDDKKMSLFHQGLSSILREHLMLFQGCTLNELVSASIEQEDACRARLEEALRPSTAWSTLSLQASHVPPFIIAVEPPSTSAGGPMSSHLPTASCSTSSSASGWGRVSLLQLWADWALLP
jgi:hypothetical protein